MKEVSEGVRDVARAKITIIKWEAEWSGVAHGVELQRQAEKGRTLGQAEL